MKQPRSAHCHGIGTTGTGLYTDRPSDVRARVFVGSSPCQGLFNEFLEEKLKPTGMAKFPKIGLT